MSPILIALLAVTVLLIGREILSITRQFRKLEKDVTLTTLTAYARGYNQALRDVEGE